MNNLLDHPVHVDGEGNETRSRAKKIAIIVSVSLLAIVAVLLIWGAINYKSLNVVMDESVEAKKSFEFAQVAIATQDFDTAVKDLSEAKEHMEAARKNLNKFKPYMIVPGISKQIRAVDDVIVAGINLSSGLGTLSQLGSDVYGLIAEKEGDVTLGDLSSEDKRGILKKLSESTVELQAVKSDIELAILSLEQVPEDGLLKQVKEAVDPIKRQLPLLEGIIHQAIPAAESLPTILGYPNEKTYLFLLQNNRELRPTGGFIGTFGIIKMADGDIQTFETDNVYNLDNPAADFITEPSPGPIAQHTSTQNWLFRNINWSPDFPTTAVKAEGKYHEEGGTEENIDGVIAVTPTFIESLLDLTGPLTVEGIEFNSEKLFETLEHQVEYGYYEQGISDADRKEVIGALADKIMEELFNLPRSEFSILWETFTENVDQKQILIFVDDPITQDLVLEQNWGGELKEYDSDFLMFVDANLAALKTDNVMERELTYSVSREGDDYYGTAEMLYRNTGYFDGFHTRYRTYTRIYLPKGAQLVEQSGFMTGDKTQGGVATEPETFEEQFTRPDGTVVDYSVVGGFIAIEPQNQGTIRIKYKLPESVTSQIQKNKYSLYVQKQAGTIDHKLNLHFDIGRKIQSGRPLDLFNKIGENTVSITTDLTVDRDFSLTLD